MMHRMYFSASLVAFVALTAPSHAAEPEFTAGTVTESRTYERDEAVSVSPPLPAMPVLAGKMPISRVTVAIEGVRITGEWENLKQRARAEDFPLDTSVQAATRKNQLLLKRPDGSVVRARIVRRVDPGERD